MTQLGLFKWLKPPARPKPVEAAPPPPPDLSEVAAWAVAWGVPGLEQRIRVKWSERQTRSLGRCAPTTGEIRLNSRLAGAPPELLREVLCHEAAHAAAYELHGQGIRSHGAEWKSLMRQVGFKARASIQLEKPLPRRKRKAGPREKWLHRCPVCGASRVATYRNSRWRCGRCYREGLEGRLEVERI